MNSHIHNILHNILLGTTILFALCGSVVTQAAPVTEGSDSIWTRDKLFGDLGGLRPALAVEVQRVVSPGGIEAWLVEDHTNPIIALQMTFRGGGALDPAGKEGLASMVASTIDEGAGPLDSQGFQGKLNDLSETRHLCTEHFPAPIRQTIVAALRMLALPLPRPRRFADEPSLLEQVNPLV